MSEDDNKSIRRFSRRNQKESLARPDSLFPSESDRSAQSESEEGVEFDIDGLALPDTDSEALRDLATLNDEVKAPRITPSEERYPPLAPTTLPEMGGSTPRLSVPKAQKRPNNMLVNTLTGLVLIFTCGIALWFVQVWNNPQSALNPFPPDTPFVVVTAPPGSTSAPMINATPDESGQIFVVITDTPVVEPASTSTGSPFPYISEPVLYAPNSNDLGCNWWSIAGTVRDLNNDPVTGYRIRITGTDLDETVFSGASQAFGAGGFELPLVGTPREDAFTVQLFSPQDAPLSEEVTVITRADCEANVAIINFLQNR